MDRPSRPRRPACCTPRRSAAPRRRGSSASNTGSAITATPPAAGSRCLVSSRSAPSTEAEGNPTISWSDQHRNAGSLPPGTGSAANGRCWSAPSATMRILLPLMVLATGPSRTALRRRASCQYLSSACSICLGDPVRSRSLATVRSTARRRAATAPRSQPEAGARTGMLLLDTAHRKLRFSPSAYSSSTVSPASTCF